MNDLTLFDIQRRELEEPLSRWELERIQFLMDRESERVPHSLRRRLAAAIVRLGVRLDPSLGSSSPLHVRA